MQKINHFVRGESVESCVSVLGRFGELVRSEEEEDVDDEYIDGRGKLIEPLRLSALVSFS